ncbi:MAG: ATP synthase F1 subunit delta [Deltaproteobacteria bacterium]|nr:MAG: ATP synthase F1 subunit delta [Deltaproteobacteria bacterium]
MKNQVVSKRYAKALLLIGTEDGRSDHYREELSALAGIVSQEAALAQVLNNPMYDTGERRNVLKAVLEAMETSDVMQSFALLLFDKKRFSLLEPVTAAYARLCDDFKGVARASITSAVELSSEAIEKIRSALEKRTGRQVELDIHQDPGLIGGIVTRIGDLVLDGSIKTQLETMRESFKRGESV